MVDIVHHSVIGFGGALVAQQMGNVDAAVGFLIGSLLPDLDVVFMALGKSRYLRLHQSVTHSVFVLPLLAVGVGCLLAFGLDTSWFVVAFACFLGSLVHVAFDMLNSFGVRATWPSPSPLFCRCLFLRRYLCLRGQRIGCLGALVGTPGPARLPRLVLILGVLQWCENLVALEDHR